MTTTSPPTTAPPSGADTPDAGPPNSPPELAPVLARFQDGDVRGARQDARALLAHASAPVTAAARGFLQSTDTDPMALAAALQ
jgi:hypothetical protein